jgi:predicted nucleic acid-binding protein
MCYFDTSFLTPLVREEKTSSRVARFMAGLTAGELAISQWTEVEVASLLARHVRMGAIQSDEAREGDALFENIVHRSFVVLSPEAATTLWPDATYATTRPACAPGTRCTSQLPRTIEPTPFTPWTRR